MNPVIAVLGSLHLDVVVRAPRLPRLGETLMGSAHHQQAGGKGLNQAVACARAGIATRMLGAVGDDAFGKTLAARLVAEGVDVSCLVTPPGCSSGMSVAVLESGGDYAAVVVSGANAALDARQVAAWEPMLRASDLLVLQNEVPGAVNAAAARFMAALGRPVVLNAAPARVLSAEDLAGVSLLVVNAVEAEMLGASPVADLDGADLAARHLTRQGSASVVVTAGPHGAAWAAPDRSTGRVAGQPVTVVSTLGAGDVFIGHLSAALVLGETIGAAVTAANRAAARHVGGGGER